MGICKVCKEVFASSELVDGVCATCPAVEVVKVNVPKEKKNPLNPNLMECITCGGLVSKSAKSCPHCGEDGGASEENAKLFQESESKSRIVSFILTVLIGPLGLMYSSVLWGAVLLIIAILGATTIVLPVGVWVLSILLGDSFTYNHNQKIKKQAKFIN